MYAAVVVNQKTNALNRIFYYEIPADLDVRLGMIVEVSFGHQRLEAFVVEICEDVDYDKEKIKPIDKIISSGSVLKLDLIELSKYITDYYLTNWVGVLQGMLPAGMHLTGKMPKSSVVKRAFMRTVVMPELRGAKQKQALEYIFNHNGALVAEVIKNAGVSQSVVKALADKNIIDIREDVVWGDETSYSETQCPELTPEQKNVVAEIDANRMAENKPVLLYGITGSGKTEIYLNQAEKVLQSGKQVIILVPEIALTPQTVRVFQGRLGSRVAVLHSNLTGSDRRKAWLGIADGKYDVVIGARSAIFAPTPDLGMIIIDEEHESSYKQENAPRFHTVNVAKKRCELTDSALILGSATPDVGDYYKALQGEYKLVVLESRVYNRDLAKLDVVDMREELKQGNNHMFSKTLQQKLADNLSAGKQSLLFLNRRGYDSFVSCRSCGYVAECSHCSVAMAYHEREKVLKCHYCGETAAVPKICPVCGSRAIRHFGAGTQKVADAVRELFPQARIARLDRDTVKDRNVYERVYRAMLKGEIDILVGTQMIAKGLDFPNVTLVGVVAADISLNLPDFRSGERTFQLITQVAGRSGRHQPGEVIVQTYSPDNQVMKAVQNQDYLQFYNNEIQIRQFAEYPPFASMIRLVVSGSSEESVHETARYLSYYIGEEMGNNIYDSFVVCWGPKPCPKYKIKDRYRLQILLKSSDLKLIRGLVKHAVARLEKEHRARKEVSIIIDVEPVSII
ncbi:MAG: replication restart helicase PriA [Bacillota bacterium]|jgi:primosomal protein N' (replication factor Y)